MEIRKECTGKIKKNFPCVISLNILVTHLNLLLKVLKKTITRRQIESMKR